MSLGGHNHYNRDDNYRFVLLIYQTTDEIAHNAEYRNSKKNIFYCSDLLKNQVSKK